MYTGYFLGERKQPYLVFRIKAEWLHISNVLELSMWLTLWLWDVGLLLRLVLLEGKTLGW
jgi:hypothetical protein